VAGRKKYGPAPRGRATPSLGPPQRALLRAGEPLSV
jgi:hypothetical protein